MSDGKRNLIYMCLFINPNYVNLLELLLNSIVLYAKVDFTTTDILVFTDAGLQPLIEAVANRLGVQLQYSFLQINTKWQASCARLDLFQYEHIDDYDKILYIDTDILLNRDVNTLFAMDIRDDKLYAMMEGRLGINYWGDQFFDFAKRKTLPSWSKSKFNEWSPAFCAGVLLFRNSTEIRTLFSIINSHINQYIFVDKNPPPEFWDQPFIVFNAVNEDKYDNELLNKYVINSAPDISGEYIIYHFPCGPGWYELKMEKMTAFAAKQAAALEKIEDRPSS
jgi:Glycosyl transferase family 8